MDHLWHPLVSCLAMASEEELQLYARDNVEDAREAPAVLIHADIHQIGDDEESVNIFHGIYEYLCDHQFKSSPVYQASRAQAHVIRVLISKIPVCDFTSPNSCGTSESQMGDTSYCEGPKSQESKHN
jgi:hypothetical protein